MKNIKHLEKQIESIRTELEQEICKVESMCLIANVAVYNHMHNIDSYSDYREDRHFFISEFISLISLKNGYVEKNKVEIIELPNTIENIQNLASKYFSQNRLCCYLKNNNVTDYNNRNKLEEIATWISLEEEVVRNPGYPNHHFQVVKDIFTPFENQIKKQFGVSPIEGIGILNVISEILSNGELKSRKELIKKGDDLCREIKYFRKNNLAPQNTKYKPEFLAQFDEIPDKELDVFCTGIFYGEYQYALREATSFTSNKISELTQIAKADIEKLLGYISVEFKDVNEDFNVFDTMHILKSKPLIKNGDIFLCPSLPLINWCLEPLFDKFLKSQNKLGHRYKISKHDYVLRRCLELFEKHITEAVVSPPNLFYNNKEYELDGLVILDKIAFVIECKSQRFTNRAKRGYIDRVEKHMSEIVKDSYEQGIRAINYLKSNNKVSFIPKNGKSFDLITENIDYFVIISLTLESLGHITPMLKTKDAFNYFRDDEFPWIISIYDLIPILEHIEFSSELFHYIIKRQKFLTSEIFNIHDELDMFSYYQSRGLEFDYLLEEGEEKNVQMIHLENSTDKFNDYYNYKFGFKSKYTPKPKLAISHNFKNFIIHLEKTKLNDRIFVSANLLDWNMKTRKHFLKLVKKMRKKASKDKQLHDFSLYFEDPNIIVTYMIHYDKEYLDLRLDEFGKRKAKSLNSKIWIGIGDSGLKKTLISTISIIK